MKKYKIVVVIWIVAFIILGILGVKATQKKLTNDIKETSNTNNIESNISQNTTETIKNNTNDATTTNNTSENNKKENDINIDKEELKKYLSAFALTKYTSEETKGFTEKEKENINIIGTAIQIYEKIDHKEFENSGKFGKIYKFKIINDIVKEIKSKEWLKKNTDENGAIQTNNKVFSYSMLSESYRKTEYYYDLVMEAECTDIVEIKKIDDNQFQIKYKYKLKNNDNTYSNILEDTINLKENTEYTYSKYSIM